MNRAVEVDPDTCYGRDCRVIVAKSREVRFSECGFLPETATEQKSKSSNFNQFSRHKILRPAKGYEPCRLLALARIKFTTNLLRSFAADSTFPSAFRPSFLHHFR